MYHFFVTSEQIGEKEIRIEGSDVNHIRNVLRMNPGEQISVSCGDGKDYRCELFEIGESFASAKIMWVQESDVELPSRICLFQGLPKGDKMELIIQKAVELGAFEIVPMATRRAVVKLDEKLASGMDETRRLIRGIRPWQSVAIFIGPEGGFDEEEIALAKEAGIVPVTLGRRILRTETAGMTVLSVLMFHLEGQRTV